jgi:transposase-like protein
MFSFLPETQAYLKHAFREMKGFDWEGSYRPMARAAIKSVLEGQLRWEIEEAIGFKPYERSQERTDYRNGSYIRHLLTEMGDVEIEVPRLRKGHFEFRALARYFRRSKSIDRAILGCFVYGHSTRKVGKALVSILGETISSSTVSRVSRCLDEAVLEYHDRLLADRYRFLFFDGIVLKKRGPDSNRRRFFLCAYGITGEGNPEMIDFRQAQGESQSAWEGFLRDLYNRGLLGEKTELIAMDGGKGLHAALEVVYSRIPRQRCWAHKARNVLDRVRKKDQPTVKKMMNRIWGAKNLRSATKAYWNLAQEWRKTYPGAVQCLEKDLDELLHFFSIKDQNLWSKIRTTNPIERAFREVKRRTKPMGVFGDRQSMERIVFAVFHHLNNSKKMNPFSNFTHNS